MPHFECGAFDHSATSPGAITGRFCLAVGRVLGEDGGADKARAERIPLHGGQTRTRKGWDRQTRQKPAVPCRVIEIMAGKCGFADQVERRFDGSDPLGRGNANPNLT